MDHTQFRTIILKPALEAIEAYSKEAEELLIATMANESRGGKFFKQVGGGPALGIFQVEKATYDDIWAHYLANQTKLARLVLNGCQYLQRPPAEHLEWNLRLATMIARIHYMRVHEPLPEKENLEGIWIYYKDYYNCGGKADKDAFMKNYKKFVGDK